MDTKTDNEKLKEIRRACTPRPLEGEGLERYFIETDESRDPHQNTRGHLKQALEEISEARLLFCGHRGCGKSTELNKFLEENSAEFFSVKFSVEKEMTPVSIHAEDLLLVMADQALKTAKEEELKVGEDLLKPILEYFEDVQERRVEKEEISGQAAGGVGVGDSVITRLMGFFAKVSGEIKYESHSERTAIATLRRRPADLLARVNGVFEAIRRALDGEKKILIVVEGLDKLDIVQAQELFKKSSQLLAGVIVNVIYTVPLFLFHSPDAGAFRHHFDGVINQRMIQVIDPPNRRARGFETVKEIVKHRVGGEAIDEEALDSLVENTAGVLRHVFDVLHHAAVKVGAGIPLQKADIEYGLHQLGQDIQPQISLPLQPMENGPQSRDELLTRLAKYAEEQGRGEKPPPESDSVNQILLKSCALVEYNGEGWFGVHPLIVSYLKRLGRLA